MTDRIARISRSALWRAGFIEANGFRCHYCNRPGGPTLGPDARAWHVDHKNPLADGGDDVEENLALACKRCNIAKHTQSYKQFRAYASVAFWNKAPDPTSEADLEELLHAWAGTPQGAWSYIIPRRDELTPYVITSRPGGEINNNADDDVAEVRNYGSRGCKGAYIADFIVHAHRMMPHLIAEIRMLRAELAEARGETQGTATEDAA